MTDLIPIERIAQKIYCIRGVKVMLDRDLTDLYEVETRVLNQAVKRNDKRFPSDFMFQVSSDEFESLKSQIVTLSWGGVRKLPYVFTEQGVAMLSSVLNSEKAIEVNIQIMRTFTELRQALVSNETLKEKIDKIEEVMVLKFQMIDDDIQDIFMSLKELLAWKPDQVGQIGFKVDKNNYKFHIRGNRNRVGKFVPLPSYW